MRRMRRITDHDAGNCDTKTKHVSQVHDHRQRMEKRRGSERKREKERKTEKDRKRDTERKTEEGKTVERASPV